MPDPSAPIVTSDFLDYARRLGQTDDWQAFRPGVTAHWLYNQGGGGPAAVLLRYEPGARVALHEHVGYEHLYVIEGDQYDIELDQLVMGIGQGPNPVVTKSTKGLELNRWGNIVVDEESMMTSIPGVFAGGDIVTGAATVILAMGAGKKASAGIDAYLKGTANATKSA